MSLFLQVPGGHQNTMQELSVGIERLDPFTLGLDCKENVPPAVELRSHTSKPSLPVQTPPSSGQENVVPLADYLQQPGQAKAAKKPLPFGSSTGHVHPVPMLALQQSLQPTATPSSPLPPLTWANSTALWHQMRLKDTCQPAPETSLQLRHPSILPTMRTILLDWMLEVCCVYKDTYIVCCVIKQHSLLD